MKYVGESVIYLIFSVKGLKVKNFELLFLGKICILNKEDNVFGLWGSFFSIDCKWKLFFLLKEIYEERFFNCGDVGRI